MFYLGVDAGGTNTSLVLITKDGKINSHLLTRELDLQAPDFNKISKTLAEALGTLCGRAGIERHDISYSVWGLPGYGEDLTNSLYLEKLVGEILANTEYTCINDVEIAWAGSLAGKPGLHLVAGTGTIGFGKDANGKTARSGGWSEIFGDEGSAYWLGIELLRLFSKQADFRLERSPLYYLLKNHYSLKRDLDLISRVRKAKSRKDIARLAMIATQAAQSGDNNALALFRRAAYELSLTAKALLKQLSFLPQTKIPLSYSGGVFKAGKLILAPLEECLAETDIILQPPILQPVLGACLCALQKGNTKYDETIVERLRKYKNIN